MLSRYSADTNPATRSAKFVDEREHFLHRVWTFISSPRILQPGNYEFPFEHTLDGDSPESVEGLLGGYVIYRLKATIDRGLLSSNIYARKHIRVIRTYEMGSPEISNGMVLLSLPFIMTC